MRDPRPPSLARLEGADGKFTAAPLEMRRLVNNGWLPIFQRCLQRDPPKWSPFQQAFGGFSIAKVHCVTFVKPQLRTFAMLSGLWLMALRRALVVCGHRKLKDVLSHSSALWWGC